MAEEVQHASVVIPRALILTVLINGVLGFGMLIGVLFCMGDLAAATSTPTGYPYMEIFLQATNSLSGTVTMICISLVIGICSAIGMIAATSRQFWSFARDRGVPGWRLWSKVCVLLGFFHFFPLSFPFLSLELICQVADGVGAGLSHNQYPNLLCVLYHGCLVSSWAD